MKDLDRTGMVLRYLSMWMLTVTQHLTACPNHSRACSVKR